MKVTLLGTGTSCGVPSIGCNCDVCKSDNPHDSRLRCSALVETEKTRILIDCGPDFRQQIMSQPFRRIDGLLITHTHYDHVGGIDDLRPYCSFGNIEIYADKHSADNLRNSIPYCFAEKKYPGVPAIHLNRLHPHVPIMIGDIEVLPFIVMHDKLPILGYRFGKFAYITDMKSIPETEIKYLTGVDTLVVNALRFRKEHHSHQLVGDAVKFIERIGAHDSYLIHCSHDIGLHDEVNRQLPCGIRLGYDGLIIDVKTE
ncbi:MBL fold metallo-hydrolase [Xylanibacter muris]|uniref:MBL fold metallo-hydrolase n=1 Tax=Xylanibacter muris TaxID=2736290 RepID=A0ABX2AN09_9BACT|nr:MBL fold metallo-hydrolase [Xylanibacter muris]NPD92394.1 MBL fold metallo-hydrolase [Xylanibacter muris]